MKNGVVMIRMDEVDKMGLTLFMARKMRGLRDTVNGLLFMKGIEPLDDKELIEVARGALDLIEEGKA